MNLKIMRHFSVFQKEGWQLRFSSVIYAADGVVFKSPISLKTNKLYDNYFTTKSK